MIFETDRCIITPIQLSDKSDLLTACDDPNIWVHLGGEPTAAFMKATVKKLEQLLPDPNRFSLRNKESGEFIGYLSFQTHHDGEYKELSYMLLSKHWGNGYATEAASEMLRYAFKELKLPKLLAETQKANTSSRKVLEKLGFQLEKELVRFGAEQTLYAIMSGGNE
ncbi:MAG: GNAT family N-acetyltransferase [Defluviitaleaceae bacterium]|nr:GNAT family N-acetyltransferase [Defluviitaleaceae bacterium]